MTENERLIREFIAAWSRLDAAELAGYFGEDGCYHNIPFEPVRGRAKVERFIAGFIKDWTATEWQIISLTCQDDRVAVERMDCTRLGDKGVDLPCFGLFEMSEGKIKVWRDYFDLATYTSAAA